VTFEEHLKSFKEGLILQDVIMRGECAEGKSGSLLKVLFFYDC